MEQDAEQGASGMRVQVRRTAGVLVAGALVLGVAGCGDDGGPRGAAVEVSRVARVRATPEEAGDGAATVRRVGTALYGPLAAGAGDGNLVLSPLSIALALGMTRAGATGDSAAQLDDLLGATDAAALHRGLNGVEAALADTRGRIDPAGEDEREIELSMANSLWGQSGATWEQPFLDTLKADYGVGIHTVDYVADAAGAQRDVNRWVADQTRDLIPDLIPDGTFDGDTRLTLVNALYFAAPWPSDLDDAGEQPFTTATGDEATVPMLGESAAFTAQQGDGWRSVTLPYAKGQLAMTLLVPDAGKLAEVEASLDADLLDEVLTGGVPGTVLDLTFPRFDLASAPKLGDALQAVGVTAPFETDSDLAPMSSDPDVQPLRLADALHRATITVDEHGTVASAATAAVFETVGAAITEDELVVDRPFLFVIHDLETATPLFLGRVTDPREE